MHDIRSEGNLDDYFYLPLKSNLGETSKSSSRNLDKVTKIKLQKKMSLPHRREDLHEVLEEMLEWTNTKKIVGSPLYRKKKGTKSLDCTWSKFKCLEVGN